MCAWLRRLKHFCRYSLSLTVTLYHSLQQANSAQITCFPMVSPNHSRNALNYVHMIQNLQTFERASVEPSDNDRHKNCLIPVFVVV